jgi:hypothetical protein
MLSNEPENVPIRPFPPKLPILALDSLPLYPYTDALLKNHHSSPSKYPLQYKNDRDCDPMSQTHQRAGQTVIILVWVFKHPQKEQNDRKAASD